MAAKNGGQTIEERLEALCDGKAPYMPMVAAGYIIDFLHVLRELYGFDDETGTIEFSQDRGRATLWDELYRGVDMAGLGEYRLTVRWLATPDEAAKFLRAANSQRGGGNGGYGLTVYNVSAQDARTGKDARTGDDAISVTAHCHIYVSPIKERGATIR